MRGFLYLSVNIRKAPDARLHYQKEYICLSETSAPLQRTPDEVANNIKLGKKHGKRGGETKQNNPYNVDGLIHESSAL